MSTFNGIIPEFPLIQVDYFRKTPGKLLRACFLSHVHSDHLTGLETLSYRDPFIYCSAATKEILLRLESRSTRVNYASGILEEHKYRYKHLKRVLKVIPLETPTLFDAPELKGTKFQVTLFDANHCTGAVMFLFEDTHTAVLYTGDIRSEPWFVNSLVRNPFMLAYTTGLKILDCVYLDTSNTGPIEFPTKAEGLKELLEKVSKYPRGTKFHFSAWTFGYEEVWMALSRALDSKIHVDKYKKLLYQSLSDSDTGLPIHHDGPVLAGYKCGNEYKEGCLTTETDARIHSCEKGMGCAAYSGDIVLIRPIIARTKERGEIGEIGIGGGMGDLQHDEQGLAIDANDVDDILQTAIFSETSESIVDDIRRLLFDELQSFGVVSFNEDLRDDDGDVSLTKVGEAIVRKLAKKGGCGIQGAIEPDGHNSHGAPGPGGKLPKLITFPYSRHSSFSELRHLVAIFRPKEVFPCTVDEKSWHEGVGMEALFGDLCSGSTFRHDVEMRILLEERAEHELPSQQTQTSAASNSSSVLRSPLKTVRFETLGSDTRDFDVQKSSILESRFLSKNSSREMSITDDNPRSSKRTRFDEVRFTPSISSTAEQIPLSSSSSPVSHTNQQNAELEISPEQNSAGASSPSSSCGRWDDDSETSPGVDGSPMGTYWDSEDNVLRCAHCRHEVFGTQDLGGICSGCGIGEDQYFEEHHGGGSLPEIYANEYDSDEPEGLLRELGDVLDYQSSAYDSLDEQSQFAEEYEQTSFIDDDSVHESESDTEGSSSDDATDYQQAFGSLQESYNKLVATHFELADEHYEMQREFLGSDFEDELDDDDLHISMVDEEGAHVIEVAQPDPVVTELVVSSFREQEDPSQIDEQRLRHRVTAAEAADGESWHKISLSSTNSPRVVSPEL